MAWSNNGWQQENGWYRKKQTGGVLVPTYVPTSSGSNQNGGTVANTVALTLEAAVPFGALVIVTISNPKPLNLTTVSDDKGNTYTAVDSVNDPNSGFSVYNFYALNVTNGPLNFTGSSVDSDFAAIQVDTFTNVATSSALDGHAIAIISPTTSVTPDAVSSGLVTPTGNGNLIYGYAADFTSKGATPGSGFSAGQSVIGTYFSESMVQPTAAPVAATFTPTSTGSFFITYVLSFKHA